MIQSRGAKGAGMSRQPIPNQPGRVFEVLLCCWLVAAQIWYYSQFKELFVSVGAPFFHRIWR
jgi:hypothetical protein